MIVLDASRLTGFFRHLPGSTSRSVFIRITKPYTPLTF
jgi:hypothetical protein